MMSQANATSMEFLFSCPLASGLHARPASLFAEVANRFNSECSITNLRNNRIANGKSVLGIIAADVRNGDKCSLRLTGPDAPSAMAALRRFVESVLPGCDVPDAPLPPPGVASTLPRMLRSIGANCIRGTPISGGIGQGKIVNLRKASLPVDLSHSPQGSTEQELELINAAVAAVRQSIQEKLRHSATSAGEGILKADLAIAGDVLFQEKLREHISLGKSAPQAVVEASEYFLDILARSENELIRQRGLDLEEICQQLLEELCGTAPPAHLELNEPCVLMVDRLAPQQLLDMNLHWLRALVLAETGATSHTAILTRSLGIPTLTGIDQLHAVLTPGEEVIVDANRGFLVPLSSPAIRHFYDLEERVFERRKQLRSRYRNNGAKTSDGRAIEVGANVSSGEEMRVAFENGADGIGLFRTEMIFLGRDNPPSEDEQFAIYSETCRLADGRPIIIRTFDIGGDKKIPYLHLPEEENPFLGNRGIRLYADHRDLLQSQLRAILRASMSGNIRIMAPMVASLEELLQFQAAVKQAKKHLSEKGVPFRADVEIGIMIEVPSVAFALDELCLHADFFSIGTNDLSQYFFAADRENPKIASRFSVREPSFLRFLKQLVDKIRESGKWIGMCGEMAAAPANLPLLLGLALDEISVPSAAAWEFKQAIGNLIATDCARILGDALTCKNSDDVDLLLAGHARRPTNLLSEELVILDSSSRTKEEVIHEIVGTLYIAGRIENRDLVEEALWAREAEYSTGLGHGFAIPHCKVDAVTANSICVLKLASPINWDSIRGDAVQIVVLLALRESDVANTHMQVFSSLARRLDDEDFRQHLIACQTVHEVTTYLDRQLSLSPGDVPTGQSPLQLQTKSQPLAPS